MIFAYVLFVLTGVFGGHRLYIQGINKTLIYIITLLLSANYTHGLSIIFILLYEIIVLPRNVLIANDEIDEVLDDGYFTKLLDMYKGNSYKKQLIKLQNKANEVELDDIIDLKEERESIERQIIELNSYSSRKEKALEKKLIKLQEKYENGIRFKIEKTKKRIKDDERRIAVKLKRVKELENHLETKTKELDNKIETTNTKLKNLSKQINSKTDEISSLDAKLSLLMIEDNRYSEVQRLREERERLENYISGLRIEKSKYDEEKRLNANIMHLKNESVYWAEIIEKESSGDVIKLEELYPSKYYNEQLKINKGKQRQMKKDKIATNINTLILKHSSDERKKMIKASSKQILRSFDNETDVKVKTLTFRNFQSKLKGIRKSYQQLNNLNEVVGIRITKEYLKLKEKELDLAYKGLVRTEEEKQLLREEREMEREEKRALKEINDKKKIVDKDIEHYNIMVRELQLQIEALKDENSKLELQNEIDKLSSKKAEREKEKEDLDYREVNAKAGYVYIISNVGSLGENMFKIGVTRRLNPQERINELSSASVPFKYDIHAMIFSYDAFQLEAELHKKFDKQRVNLVNKRKEFFYASIEDIQEVLKNYGNLVIDWDEDIEAIEYYETLKLREETYATNNSIG